MPATLRVSSNGLDKEEVGVDQVIRLALGVAEWEAVTVSPFTHERFLSSKPSKPSKPWRLKPRLRRPGRRDQAAHWIAPAVHVVARVQPAELTLTEQRACLMSRLALDSLGLKSGDEVLLHAVQNIEADSSHVGRGQRIHTKQRLKAYEAPEEVTARRMAIYGGGRGAPLPSEEAAFQFSQALTWVWVDAAVRTQMGLPAQLGAVVVAPSRWFVLMDNLREVALVAAVALTAAAIEAEGDARWVLGGLAVALPVALIGIRIRTRLR